MTEHAGRTDPPAAAHLVGIGGMHMSAIAQILLRNGTRVSGSDQAQSALTERLREAGAAVHYGHAAENVGDVDLVVTTAAAKPDNPELLEAQRRGIPVISRAAMVARLMAGRISICVAGTHGKTTTSSMIAWVLRQAGRDPSFLLGGESIDLGTNAWAGDSDEIVVEADEYARAFLEYSPKLAVVTNVESDHLEYYGSVEAYEDAFRQFMQRVRPDGVIIACADSPRLAALAAEGYLASVETYQVVAKPGDQPGVGVFHAPSAAWWAADQGLVDGFERQLAVMHRSEAGATQASPAPASPAAEPDRHRFPNSKQTWLGSFTIQVPGQHMAANALAAVAACVHLGVDIETVFTALAGFRGARRRFEFVGRERDVTVIDDFAHHPTEIAVNLAAARERFPGQRLVLIFQPHTYSRSAYLRDQFAGCFRSSDLLFMLETYASRETAEAGLSAQQLAEAVISPPAEYVRTPEDAADRLLAELRSGDVLVTMGAGDVDRVGRAVLEGLRSP